MLIAGQRERILRIRELAAKHGRADKMRFGIRLYIITRDTDEAGHSVAANERKADKALGIDDLAGAHDFADQSARGVGQAERSL